MDKIKVSAYGKINLNLYIKGKRPNGYHELSTLMHSVPLCDELTVSLSDEIAITCDNPELPCDSRNIVYKSISAYFGKSGKIGGAAVHIKKRIPIASGFGGSSTDGAAVLFALEKLCGFLGENTLFDLAAELSADMPFCLYAAKRGYPFYEPFCGECRGIGEIINEVKSPVANAYAVLAKAGEGLTSKEMYSAFDSASENNCKNIAIFNNTELYNDFEKIAAERRPKIAEALGIARTFTDAAIMSGSGSGIFSLFSEADSAEKCAEALSENGFEPYMLSL